MTRQLISLEVDGSIFALRGWKAHGLALGAGLRPTFSGIRGAWVADTKRLPDLVAHLERRRIAFEVIESDVDHPDIKEPVRQHGADGDLLASNTDDPLFELDGSR